MRWRRGLMGWREDIQWEDDEVMGGSQLEACDRNIPVKADSCDHETKVADSSRPVMCESPPVDPASDGSVRWPYMTIWHSRGPVKAPKGRWHSRELFIKPEFTVGRKQCLLLIHEEKRMRGHTHTHTLQIIFAMEPELTMSRSSIPSCPRLSKH